VLSIPEVNSTLAAALETVVCDKRTKPPPPFISE